MRKVVRVCDLKDPKKLSTANRTWCEAGKPGLAECYSISLPSYVDMIIDSLRDKGYYPNPLYWYYDVSQVRYLTVAVSTYWFDIAVPQSWYLANSRVGNSHFCNRDFYRRLTSDDMFQALPQSGVREGQYSAGETYTEIDKIVNGYVDYFVLNVMEDYINMHRKTLMDVDKMGGYAFLLFYEDTGEMLSEYEAEGWWCDNDIKAIKRMFADNISLRIN